jgi:hypothetical protein
VRHKLGGRGPETLREAAETKIVGSRHNSGTAAIGDRR